MEEGHIQEYVTKQIENNIGGKTDEKVVQKVDEPIVGNAHAVHTHHLDKFFFFFKNNQI